MTHASVPAEQRAELGINDNFIRMSIGLENADDLLNDINNALNIAVRSLKIIYLFVLVEIYFQNYLIYSVSECMRMIGKLRKQIAQI